jgi:hypothetical protein
MGQGGQEVEPLREAQPQHIAMSPAWSPPHLTVVLPMIIKRRKDERSGSR